MTGKLACVKRLPGKPHRHPQQASPTAGGRSRNVRCQGRRCGLSGSQQSGCEIGRDQSDLWQNAWPLRSCPNHAASRQCRSCHFSACPRRVVHAKGRMSLDAPRSGSSTKGNGASTAVSAPKPEWRLWVRLAGYPWTELQRGRCAESGRSIHSSIAPGSGEAPILRRFRVNLQSSR